MVWRDWELITTNRVQFYHRYFHFKNPYYSHIWYAQGGWCTTLYSLLGACAGYGLFSHLHGKLPELFPLRTYSIKQRALLAAFSFLGYLVMKGIAVSFFGNPTELKRLELNREVYKKELDFYGKATLA